MILHCWKFVTSAGLVEDCPGGDVLEAGKSVQELFQLGWETVRQDLTDGGALICLRYRLPDTAPLVPQRVSVRR
jgi:hypothetical protein